MIIVSPHILKDDLGFQLSFAATAGLIVLQPRIAETMRRFNLKIRNSLPEFLVTSSATICAAQLATLPIIVSRFGVPSLLIFPANLVLAPMASVVMFLSLITVIISFVSPTLSNIAGYATFLSATYIIQGAEFLTQIRL